MPTRLRWFYSCLTAGFLLLPSLRLYSMWDRIHAAGLEEVLLYSTVIGALLVVLLLTATGRLAYRGEKPDNRVLTRP